MGIPWSSNSFPDMEFVIVTGFKLAGCATGIVCGLYSGLLQPSTAGLYVRSGVVGATEQDFTDDRCPKMPYSPSEAAAQQDGALSATASPSAMSCGPTAEERLRSHALDFSPEEYDAFDTPTDAGSNDDAPERALPCGLLLSPRCPPAKEVHACTLPPSHCPLVTDIAPCGLLPPPSHPLPKEGHARAVPPSYRPLVTNTAPSRPLPPPRQPLANDDHACALLPLHRPVVTTIAPSGPLPPTSGPPAKEEHACAPSFFHRPLVTNIAADASSTSGALQTQGLKSPTKDHARPVRGKTLQGRASRWGSWRKKLAVGGAILGAGVLMASASRRK